MSDTIVSLILILQWILLYLEERESYCYIRLILIKRDIIFVSLLYLFPS